MIELETARSARGARTRLVENAGTALWILPLLDEP